MKVSHALVCLTFASTEMVAQSAAISLPEVTVYSPQVANQQPVGAFAMPVSALRYEPRVDLQGRNLAEGQADIAIRGGTFENTGFQLGALSLYDPQTGHYFAELPVAPAMLGAPGVLTGAEQATRGWNATAGSIAYSWRPIRTAGAVTLGGGDFGSYQQELYQGYRSGMQMDGGVVAADVGIANSGSNGSRPFGESRFWRASGRVQVASEKSQTDFIYGYQEKFFGWPNLYTPFNSNETENLQTVLAALNHRVTLANGGYAEVGAYWRRNKDDYAFNRFAPLSAIHPFQHTTRTKGVFLNGRGVEGDWALAYKAGVLHDDLQSSSLKFGYFNSRTFLNAGLYPERRWKLADGDAVTVTAGAALDDTNRDSAAISPMLLIARERAKAQSGWSKLYFSYSKTTQEPTYTALNSSRTSGLFRGNPDLKRSSSHNLELGASAALLGWDTTAAVFYRRDDRLVDWTFQRNVTARFANAVDIDTGGIELFARRTFDWLDVVLGYTALTKDADYRGAAADASFYALNYTKHRLTAAFTARLGSDWEVRLDNDLRIQADNVLRTMGGDHPWLSALGVYYRPAAIRGMNVGLQVSNVWNSSFETVPGVPAAKRQINGNITYAW